MNIPCCCCCWNLEDGDVSPSGDARGDTRGEGDTKGENIPPLDEKSIGLLIISTSPPPPPPAVAAASNNAFSCDSHRTPLSAEGVAVLFCVVDDVEKCLIVRVVELVVAANEEVVENEEEDDG